jgi:hypothetical protein
MIQCNNQDILLVNHEARTLGEAGSSLTMKFNRSQILRILNIIRWSNNMHFPANRTRGKFSRTTTRNAYLDHIHKILFVPSIIVFTHTFDLRDFQVQQDIQLFRLFFTDVNLHQHYQEIS